MTPLPDVEIGNDNGVATYKATIERIHDTHRAEIKGTYFSCAQGGLTETEASDFFGERLHDVIDFQEGEDQIDVNGTPCRSLGEAARAANAALSLLRQVSEKVDAQGRHFVDGYESQT